jgi:superfamily II DNA or RNA helicase
MNQLITKYKTNIYDIYRKLKKENVDITNYDLSKIAEYYSCILCMEKYDKSFYVFEDIDVDFKINNNLCKYDTGIDFLSYDMFIGQTKLRKNNLTWRELSTFLSLGFLLQNRFQNIHAILHTYSYVKLHEQIIGCQKSGCLSIEFLDNLIEYCDSLLQNKDIIKSYKSSFIVSKEKELRDYQKEVLDLIKTKNNENMIINLPTGTGKTVVMSMSIEENKKYLILVPYVILLEQTKNTIIHFRPELKNTIQLIGDCKSHKVNENKNIIICVYNSIIHLEKYVSMNYFDEELDDYDEIENEMENEMEDDETEDDETEDDETEDEELKDYFYKIYIDEMHHIYTPSIYNENIDFDDDNDNEIDEDNDEKTKDKEDTYLRKIYNITKNYNNIIGFSATIDELDDFNYYTKSLREMIDKGYLCDYEIKFPIFSSKNDYNFCKYIAETTNHTIIYCENREKGLEITNIINTIIPNSCAFIDCLTSKKDRLNIIQKYKDGELLFLVNIRVLIEGFDSPITRNIFMFNTPSSKKLMVQILGRALRLYPTKSKAFIIFPCIENEDMTKINKCMKMIIDNDDKYLDLFNSKKYSGFLNYENRMDRKDNDDDDDDLNIDYFTNYIDEYVFDSYGILIGGVHLWIEKLDKVKMFIDENGRRPNKRSKNKEEKTLGYWISDQKKNCKDNKNIMKNDIIKKHWIEFINDEKYSKYFLSNQELWTNNLNEVKMFIDKNNKLPTKESKNKEEKTLGKWVSHQKHNHKKNQFIMKLNIDIKKLWIDFINDEKYRNYFLSNKEIWMNNLNELKKFIDENDSLPSSISKNDEEKTLINWLNTQKQNYKNNSRIIKNEKIKEKWKEFINDEKYKTYLLSYEELWKNNLFQVKKFINENYKKPTKESKNKEEKALGTWVLRQKKNYKNNSGIIKNIEIKKLWEDFINDEKYIKYIN